MSRIIQKTRTWAGLLFIVIIIYCISHGLMLFLYGAWWDDMEIWNVSDEALKKLWGTGDNPVVYYLYKEILAVTDLHIRNFIFRIIPFMCWMISIICFFLFLKKVTDNKTYTFYSSLLVGSCGINKCMVLLCCYHYTISISLFLMGLVLYTNDYYKERKINIVFVSILWFLSLVVWRSAALVIPAILLFSVLSKIQIDFKSKLFYKKFLQESLRHYGMIILALLIFVVMYKTILAPHGEYAAYYSINILCMLLSPLTTVLCSISLFLGYISNLYSVFAQSNTIIVFVLFIWVAICSLFLYKWSSWTDKKEVNKKMLLIACLFLLFSMMPHLLRELACSYDLNGYKSRVSSLAVFPLCMILAYPLIFVKIKFIRSILCSTLVVLSIFYTINTYLCYEKGWLKNEAIVCYLKNNMKLKGKNIIFIDNSKMYSPFYNEDYRYYDYEGCAKLSYGKDDNTKCIDYFKYKENKHFESADYYLFIDVKERNAHAGLKSIVCRVLNKHMREEMKNNILMFRLETKEEYENNNK